MEKSDLYCEKLKVLLNKKQEIKSMVAHEKLKMVLETGTVYADQLYWDEGKKMASLTGHPYVIVRTKDLAIRSAVVWYHIEKRKLFTRGKGIFFERSVKKSKGKKQSKK